MRFGLILAACLLAVNASGVIAEKSTWDSLFDGATLNGWLPAESKETFSVSNGEIVAHGPRAHLFYVGPLAKHDWRDFELSMEVKTSPGANSGVYFHTRFQDAGFPEAGYQVQINNTHIHPSRTGGLYGVEDRETSPVRDNVWFELLIRVEGKRIITKLNGQTICDYVEPENPARRDEVKGSVLSHGTIALQGHDKDSETHFRNIRIRSLERRQ